ncbi:hypothetical protein M2318_002758 [Metapseudomonas resinovorans]
MINQKMTSGTLLEWKGFRTGLKPINCLGDATGILGKVNGLVCAILNRRFQGEMNIPNYMTKLEPRERSFHARNNIELDLPKKIFTVSQSAIKEGELRSNSLSLLQAVDARKGYPTAVLSYPENLFDHLSLAANLQPKHLFPLIPRNPDCYANSQNRPNGLYPGRRSLFVPNQRVQPIPGDGVKPQQGKSHCRGNYKPNRDNNGSKLPFIIAPFLRNHRAAYVKSKSGSLPVRNPSVHGRDA